MLIVGVDGLVPLERAGILPLELRLLKYIPLMIMTRDEFQAKTISFLKFYPIFKNVASLPSGHAYTSLEDS